MNQAGQIEEQNYYEKIIGLQGDFLFADTMQEARLAEILLLAAVSHISANSHLFL